MRSLKFKYTFMVTMILSMLLFSMPSWALRLGGHVWVGQQIINDLQDDGKLTFQVGSKTITVAVSNDLKNAILNNQSDFLMGNIGPDAVPDVVVGQTSVHPGVDYYWQTNDWMEYLLDQSDQTLKAKAFVYGYLGHAAADVFAHTYVNQYAGDIFELDHETLVEKRHIVLEGYIDKHLPPLKDYQGQMLPDITTRIQLDDEYAEFIRDTLIYNDTVENQYWENPYATHLAAYYSFRKSIDQLAENSVWHEMDIVITQIVAAYFEIELSDDEAKQIVDVSNELLDFLNEEVIDGVQEKSNQLFTLAVKYEQMQFDAVSEAVRKVDALEADLVEHKHQIENEVLSLSSELNQGACHILAEFVEDPMGVLDPLGLIDPAGVVDFVLEHDPVTNFLSDLLNGSHSDPRPFWAFTGDKTNFIAAAQNHHEFYIFTMTTPAFQCSNASDISPCPEGRAAEGISRIMQAFADTLPEDEVVTYEYWGNNTQAVKYDDGIGFLCSDIANLTNDVQRNLLHSIQSLEKKFLASKKDMIVEVNTLREEMQNALIAINNMANSIINLAQTINADVNPIQSVLRGWRSDLDIAMREYVKASGQMMINTLDPQASSTDPMIQWFDCYHASIIGIPQTVSGCEFRQSMQTLLDAVDNIENIMSNMALTPELRLIKNAFDELKNDLIGSLEDELREEVAEQLTDIIPQEVEELIELMEIEFSDSDLNFYFSKQELASPVKNLLMIPDMASRIKAEMHLQNGVIDTDKYPVIRNALVLAKLALLEPDALQDFDNQLGNPVDDNGTSIFLGYENLVATAFENIDGNHQWMPVSPPLPNAQGVPYNPQNQSYDTEIGFLLWNDAIRDELFNQLFIGPLSPGVDDPASIGKDEIVPSDYPYQPCSYNPYPDDIDDQTCNTAWLIVIINMLLH
ncbi:MAG: zinc dependent phospholipase C family protein [Maribacter sp.]|nr:zinc dependent phospholipase C family protein [Maribacter sp.]